MNVNDGSPHSNTKWRRVAPWRLFIFGLLTIGAFAHKANAQGFTTDDAVIKRIYSLGMDSSHVQRLIQALTDSVGPRVTGSAGLDAASAWVLAQYKEWGINTRTQTYGTWRSWKRGLTSIELTAPRTAQLSGRLLTWSPGTDGKAVTGGVIVFPDLPDSAAFQRWLPGAKGKFVMFSPPELTCRPDASMKEWATAEAFDASEKRRKTYSENWITRLERTGLRERQIAESLGAAGVAGILSSAWPQGWGVVQVENAITTRAPSVSMSCEDYGLVARLVENNGGATLRLTASSYAPSDVPAYNTFAEIKGAVFPTQFVILSAHLDSWDSATGATDNGTGTIVMMEAMRILREAYPAPKRTILVGHWSGEEQGGNGSAAFAEDNEELLKGTRVVFNQDNGTGRITRISMGGFTHAGARFSDWLAQMPTDVSRWVALLNPGLPGGGSDHVSFQCRGVPAFSLNGDAWDYGTYTQHSNLDTYDKIGLEELRFNATLIAMLAYQAANDTTTFERDKRILPVNGGTGRPRNWPACQKARRSWSER